MRRGIPLAGSLALWVFELILEKRFGSGLGSNYLNTLLSLRSAAASAIAAQIKILCMTHHIGLILVDEIQNVITTAQKNHQTKVLFESAKLEYIYCTADDGSRFRGYAILEAVIYPVQETQKPQWSEPKCAVGDLPVAIVNGRAYAIDQLKNADDRREFSHKRPDLAPALAIMFQPK